MGAVQTKEEGNGVWIKWKLYLKESQPPLLVRETELKEHLKNINLEEKEESLLTYEIFLF